MSQVERTARDEEHGAVWCDVTETDHDVRNGAIGCESQADDGMSEHGLWRVDDGRLAKCGGFELFALIAWQIIAAERTPRAGRRAVSKISPNYDGIQRPVAPTHTAVRPEPALRLDAIVRRRPTFLGDPSARSILGSALRCAPVLFPHREHWFRVEG